MKLDELPNIICRNIMISRRNRILDWSGVLQKRQKVCARRENDFVKICDTYFLHFTSVYTDSHATEMGLNIICPIQYVSLYSHIRGSSAYPVCEEIYDINAVYKIGI